MRRVIAVALGAAVLPVVVTAVFQKGVLQDEAPIRVRNGSVEIETLRETEWAAEGGLWSQNQASAPSGGTLLVEVRYMGGGTCKLQGTTVRIVYGDNRVLTITRSNKRIKVSPKARLDQDTTQRALLRANNDGDVTKVTASGTGRASCEMESKAELKEICIAASDIGLGNCRTN